MRKILVVLLVAIVAGCSQSAPTSWEGQGLTFTEAANQAVTAFWSSGTRRLFAAGLTGTAVCFVYDDNGHQAEGCVTVFPFGWFVAPGQAGQAYQVEYLDYQTLMAPMGRNCEQWPERCQLVGFRPPDPWEICSPFLGCPVYQCESGCPATSVDD